MIRAEAIWTDFYLEPGRFLDHDRVNGLAKELGHLDSCSGRRLGDVRALLDGRVLALARRPDGALVGCCSATASAGLHRPLLDMEPPVVAPGQDPGTLGAALEETLIGTYLARQRPLGRVWVRRGGPDARPRAVSLVGWFARRISRRLTRQVARPEGPSSWGLDHALLRG